MTHIFISPNNEYPRHIGDIYREHPDFDGINLPNGWHPVTPTPPLNGTRYQYSYETFPLLIDGKYYQSWELIDMTEEEKAAVDRIENTRNE